MKRLILSIALVLSISTGATTGQTPDPLETFVNQINAEWQQSDDAGILQLITARLQSDSDDLLGLGIKAYYHVYVANDLNEARIAITAFYNQIDGNAQVSQEVKDAAKSLRDEIHGIPLSESGSLSAQEKTGLHTIFPDELPMSKKVLGISKAVAAAGS